MIGTIKQATENGSGFIDSRSNDFIVSTSKLSQKILMGFSSNFPSSFSLGYSNLVIGSATSNVRIDHFGDIESRGNVDIHQNLKSSNLYVTNNVGIGVNNNTSNFIFFVTGNTRIIGDLVVDGDMSSINTNVSITDQFHITNDGTGPALMVNQMGNTPLLAFQLNSNNAFYISEAGDVSIGSNMPLEKLDVQGDTFIRGNLMLSNILGSNITVNNIHALSNLYVDVNATIPNIYNDNLYMGNKLVIDNTGIITNSNFIPTLDTSKIQYGTFTSNFIENYNVISNKLASNLTISGTTFFSGIIGIDTSNPALGLPYVKMKIEGGDMFVGGQGSFSNIGDQARIYLGDGNHFLAATSNVGIVMQVPDTSYPFVLEDGSGYLGLGTMDPEERLHVANNAKVNNNMYVMNRVGIAFSNPLETLAVFGNMSLSNYGKVVISTSNDFIGINTANPIAKLHILQDHGGDNLLIEDATNTLGTVLVVKDDGKVGMGVQPSENLDVYANIKARSNTYIGDRFGVRTSNPIYTADIKGDLRAVKQLCLDGDSYAGGQIRLYSAGLSSSSNTELLDQWMVENKPYNGCNYLRVLKYDSNGVIDHDNTTLISDDGYMRIGGAEKATERVHVSHGHVKIDSNLYVMQNVGIRTSNPTEYFDLASGNAKFASNVYIMSRLGVNTSNPEYTLDVNGSVRFAGNINQDGTATFSSNMYVMNYVGIGTSNPQERLDIPQGNIDLGSNIYVGYRLGVANKNPTERIDITGGNLKVSSNIYAFSRIGISTSNPQVALEINDVDAVLIPKGTTGQRPGIPVLGHIRYNTTISSFEGFGAGNTWGTLGGVKDVNLDTYISAEEYPTSNDDIMRFYTSNNEVMRIMTNGYIGMSNKVPSERLEVSGGNAKFNSNVYVYGRQGSGTSNPSEALDLVGNIKISSNIYTFSRIGISTSNPRVALEINDVDAVLIPKGTTGQRPGVPVLGHIRYNTTISSFEGFGAGNTWGTLGGVKDVNLDTYISAEEYPTSNDDILRFYTSNNEVMRIMTNGYIGMSNKAPSERLEVSGGNAKFNSNVYVYGRQGNGTSNPSEALDLVGNVKISSNIYTFSRIGISTSNPRVALEINDVDAVLIPKGTTAQRPGVPVLGHIRYNTTISSFEGFGAGNTWGTLGGVKDVNLDTYISAEAYPTSNDDILRFYTSNNEVMRIMTNGYIGMSNKAPSERLEVSGGNAKFNSNIYVGGRIGVGLSNPAQSIHIVGNIRATNGTLGPMINLIPPFVYADIAIGDRLILDNTLEAGNDIASSSFKPLFSGPGFLYQDCSDDGMIWNEARIIFRGTALTDIDNEYTSMVVQDYMYNRTPVYSNISPAFSIVSRTQSRGYLTYGTPWFTMSTTDVRHLALYINGSSNNTIFRFGSVYLQFRG